MGGCQSGPAVAPSTRAIDRELMKDRDRIRREIKLLLLGTGGAGKSTIAKQMKILHLNGYSERELQLFIEFVRINLFKAMKLLVRGADRFGHQISKENAETAEEVRTVTLELDSINLTPELGERLKKLWLDDAIQETYAQHRFELQLDDSADYFFAELERVSQPDYLPTTDDALHVRIKTTGLKEIQFATGAHHFRVVDVGGQRNERRKWIHCFQDVTALLFVVALNDYALMLEEDPTTNRMHEALKLFGQIINNHWFEKTPVVLFLNKVDLFEEMVTEKPIQQCFPAYDGPAEFEPSLQFIRDRFNDMLVESGRTLYAHNTCATDTENVAVVWQAVCDINLDGSITEMGF